MSKFRPELSGKSQTMAVQANVAGKALDVLTDLSRITKGPNRKELENAISAVKAFMDDLYGSRND